MAALPRNAEANEKQRPRYCKDSKTNAGPLSPPQYGISDFIEGKLRALCPSFVTRG
ncbi:hypothetical protein [uncultured Draconibacterium sp.]|uniref:hypothetical protein n=1 Tax=uncultured Draconibacterium sp. TaxID=1573823 RepID=UPI0032604DD3